MPKIETFEYAFIRLVPKVEREEFLNIGVVVFSKQKKFLKLKYHLDKKKLGLFSNDLDFEELRNHLESWDVICKGEKQGGAIALAEMPYRFRWITAPKSTIIQCSKVHPGISSDPTSTLEKLFQQNVL